MQWSKVCICCRAVGQHLALPSSSDYVPFGWDFKEVIKRNPTIPPFLCMLLWLIKTIVNTIIEEKHKSWSDLLLGVSDYWKIGLTGWFLWEINPLGPHVRFKSIIAFSYGFKSIYKLASKIISISVSYKYQIIYIHSLWFQMFCVTHY